MAKTSIEWTDMSWNPLRAVKGRWHCTHVSEGCRNCYAERINQRWGGPDYKPGADTFRLDEKILEQPLHWRTPRKIFACDMTDLFHEDIPENFIRRVFFTMAVTKRHTYQVLTKRPERMHRFLTDPGNFMILTEALAAYTQKLGGSLHLQSKDDGLSGLILPNVWLGVSVEDQKTADERIPLLLETPAAVRFVSYEPALGPVDFTNLKGGTFDCLSGRDFECLDVDNTPGLDWLIAGGESGPQARPMHPAWARSAIAQCKAADVSCFVKQMGSAWAKKHGGDSKGGDWSFWPDDLRIREFPHVA